MQNTVEKKKKVTLFICLALVLLLSVIAISTLIIAKGSETKKIKKQLELGEKYFDELDYDNAIFAYEKAIEIDSKCEDAYLLLADACVAKADKILAEDSSQKALDEALNTLEIAINNLSKGENEIDSDTLKNKKIEIEAKIEEISKILSNYPEESESIKEMNALEDEANNKKTIKKITEYNAEGIQISCSEFDEKGNEIKYISRNGTIIQYEYKEDNTLIQKYYYPDSDKTETYEIKTEIDSKGNESGYTCLKEGEISYVDKCEYDNEGNLIKRTSYNANGEISVYSLYEYDADGNMFNRNYFADGRFNSGNDVYVDSEKNCIKQVIYDSDSNVVVNSEFQYEYDNDKNILKRTQLDSEGKVVSYSEYEYYE